MHAFSVQQIADRLNDRFHLLNSGSRAAPLHHQTLHALIDWSYELLSTDERKLFGRLSVFAGGWTLEAAEIVCSSGELPTPELRPRDAFKNCMAGESELLPLEQVANRLSGVGVIAYPPGYRLAIAGRPCNAGASF